MKQLAILFLFIVCTFSSIQAQNTVQIKNRYRANHCIQLEGQKLKSGLLGANKSNGEWTIEQVDKEFFRIKKTGTNLYLHTEKTKIECSSVPAGYFTSHWKKVAAGGKYFRIENRYRKGQVLHVESALASSAVPAGYFTSHWEFVKVTKTLPTPKTHNITGDWKPLDKNTYLKISTYQSGNKIGLQVGETKTPGGSISRGPFYYYRTNSSKPNVYIRPESGSYYTFTSDNTFEFRRKDGSGLTKYQRYTNPQPQPTTVESKKMRYRIANMFGGNSVEGDIVPYNNVVETERGKSLQYNLVGNTIAGMYDKEGKVKLGDLSLNITPEVAYFNNEGKYYVYLKMENSSINMARFRDHKNEKGFYLKKVSIRMGAEGMDLLQHSPKNENQSGTHTTSESFTLGGQLSASGPSASVGKTWGSSFSSTVKNFEFANSVNPLDFHWRLGMVGDLSKGDESVGPYSGPASLGDGRKEGLGQYTRLKHLPPVAANNFPIQCEGIYGKYVGGVQNMPDKVIAVVIITAVYEATALVPYGEGDTALNMLSYGFGAGVFNPRVHEGTAIFQFKSVEVTTQNIISLELDLKDLKK